MSEKNGSNGPTQDATTGQFVKGGGGGPGRKPGIKVSFRTAARKRAEEMDIDLDKEVGTLALLLLKQAKAGDVHAAKFVVERLCGLLKQEVDLKHEGEIGTGPSIPAGKDLDNWRHLFNRISDEGE